MSTVIDKTQKSVSKGSRKQWGYDARDMLTQGFAAKAKRLLLGLSDSEGIGAIAESVGLGKHGLPP